MKSGILKQATNQTAYLKLGILGFEGSGKTHTAILFACGMASLTNKKKVAFFDTEKGSDFHIKRMKDAGIQFDSVKSRSFKDLCDTIREAEANGYGFLIIDSITHVWRDLCSSWLKKKNKPFLTMKDWGVLKEEWRQFTDLYVNSKLSIAMLGRAGHEYDMDEDEDGNQEIKKAGTKMKVETETGFEPDLLLEMFKVPKIEKKTAKNGKTVTKKVRGFQNACVVLKDRTDTINGKQIEMPKFKDFESVIKSLNIGGEHHGVDTSRTSEGVFKDRDWSYSEKQKRREIAIERIHETLTLSGLDGRSAEANKKRTELLIKVLGTSAKTAIENKEPGELEEAVEQLRIEVGLDKKENMPPKIDETEQVNF